jgi:RIO kinase 1
MEFLGENKVCAPRLKDITFSFEELQKQYIDLLIIIRRLFHVCKLVHADLSEYNILYYKTSLYIIDVSQSVDSEHPYALSFLREDCMNINNFFKKQGINTLTSRELFNFVVKPFETNDDSKNLLEILANQVCVRNDRKNNTEFFERIKKDTSEYLQNNSRLFKSIHFQVKKSDLVERDFGIRHEPKKASNLKVSILEF